MEKAPRYCHSKGAGMQRVKKRKTMNADFESREIPVSFVDTKGVISDYDKRQLKNRAAYFMLNGVPEFSVNEKSDGRFELLVNEEDFFAAKLSGAMKLPVRVYRFTTQNAELFSLIECLKSEKLPVMEQAYKMKRLVSEFSLTQDDVAALIGASRPAVANTLRLLTLDPSVLGLIESEKLSAGHARTLVRVPQNQQLAFAQEAIKRGYSVREMERAVKAFLTPPEVLQMEKQAKANAKGEELKALIERMRRVYRTKVSLIGNDKKGRIYIDYYSPEDLYRFEEFLEIIERYQND